MELQKQQYLNFIVTALHIELSDFMQCVAAKDRCYEPLIYRWILTLFEKGVPKKRALQIIQRARVQILLQNSTIILLKFKAQQLVATEQLLKRNAYYNQLSDEHKAIAIQKIARVINQPEISKERIDAILQNMNLPIGMDGKEKKSIIFKNTLIRVKKKILKIVDTSNKI